LDISVFELLKSMCSRGIDSWLKTHPGKTLTIYDLPGIVNYAILNTFVPSNITSGFASAGIFPFNPDKYQLHDFVASYDTDRPIEEEREQVLPPLAPAPSGLQNISSLQGGGNSPDLITVSTLKICVHFQKLDLEKTQIEGERGRKQLS
jgi:hypothetical protein